MRNTSILLTCLCLRSLAQVPGSVDATFNPTDAGYAWGDGFTNPAICGAIQSDGKIVVGGHFVGYGGGVSGQLYSSRNHIARLNTDGTLDATFDPGTGFDQRVESVAIQPDGKILACGFFTTFNGAPVGYIVRLTATGALDPTFNTGTGFNNGMLQLALQPDGKMLVAGSATDFNGSAIGRFARLNSNGTLDATFNVGGGGFNSTGTSSVALQSDGKILVGGAFDQYNGISRTHFARLNNDGSLDMAYAPAVNDGTYSIVLQPDGKALIGGWFTDINGLTRIGVARLLTTGAVDLTFNAGSTVLGGVSGVALTSTGAILVGGYFNTTNGASTNYFVRLTSTGAVDGTFNLGAGCDGNVVKVLVQTDGKVIPLGWFNRFDRRIFHMVGRLNANGSPDTAFNPGTGVQLGGQGYSAGVLALARQSDGKLLVGGTFFGYNKRAQPGLVRVHTDGSLDASFDCGTNDLTYMVVTAIVVQPDGKVLVGGGFSTFNGQPRGCLVRLNSDGSEDLSFSLGGAGFANGINALALQADGKVVVGGSMTTLNGAPCDRIVRLNANGTVDPTFDPGTGPNGPVNCMLLQPDGKILVGGSLTQVNGTQRGGFARLWSNGILDATFLGGSGISGPSPRVLGMALQPDGKVVLVGDFTHCHGVARANLARVNGDGNVDLTFVNAGVDNSVRSVALQADGKLVIGGGFLQCGGNIERHRIARLHPNGGVDQGFPVLTTSGTGSWVDEVLIQPDGKIIAAGDFVKINDAVRNRLARLNGGDSYVRVSPKVFLQGPYDSGSQTMSDALRVAGLVPLAQPYSALGFAFVAGGGSETTTTGALAVTGNNAIVDHVVVELRTTASMIIVASVDALVQRDGDVVAMDGVSPVTFSAIPASYRVAVRHRNHLGVLSAAAFALSSTPTVVDFTLPGTGTYGTNAQVQIGTRMALWAADGTGNGQVKYTGTGNDRDPILTAVGNTTPNNVLLNQYSRLDANMDGSVKYTGAANDRDIILTNVGSSTPNNTRTQQLP
ncbi:MAG: delta-60 repeat domain-containing protein [Flavobacteriales bacterium]|nr:delta-60 repeat domain-containing protein [Flavobacteriales bacterium]